jgi:2-dehydro-3-deoxyphosphogluconate aldolase/(4S)-4-hydroxy-2-oxoglutarate aldolase
MKLFPAEPSGGLGLLQALSAPFPTASFCPTGGIGPANAESYLALPNVVAVGGSWITRRDPDSAGWDKVVAKARAAANLG